jgi:peptidoglycan hydrolase-like protein with peptidoglycan-binding domain
MDSLLRERTLRLLGVELRAVENGGGGGGIGRDYKRDPKGSSTGGQFTKNPASASSTTKPKSTSRPSGPRRLERGARGEDVKALQRALTAIGIPTAADGIFGPKTQASVRDAQRRFGLEPTGIVTAELLRAIGEAKQSAKPVSTQTLGSASRSLKSGDSGDDVKELQRLMSALGVPADVDGAFGPKTKEAVKQIQRRLGLKPTGTATKSLISKMLAAYDLSPCIKRSEG